MTGVAELVIGGVALTGLFDTCMNTFNRLDDGKNCSRDYQEAALSIALLGNRLNRWEEVYHASGPSLDFRSGILAEAALKSVNTSLARVCKTAERYERGDSLNGIASVTAKVQSLTLGKAKTNLGAKIVWALRDKDRVTEVILGLKARIEELESLSEALIPAIKSRGKEQMMGLEKLAVIEEPQKAIPIVKTIAAKFDPCLDKAVTKATGHKYDNINAYDEAQVNDGDMIAMGYDGPLVAQNNEYKNVSAHGKARVNNGNMYGRSIFD